MTQPPNKPQAARVHPDDRSRIAALNAAGLALRGAPTEKPQTSYYTPELIQCTLPHSDPKTRDWIRKNGNFTLIVSSGVDKDGIPFGIPYGSFPRLVLAYMITRVVQTGERQISFNNYFSGFLKEIGYTGNLKGNIRPARTIREQLFKLLRASITFDYSEGDGKRGAMIVQDVKIAPKFALWWDYKNADQGNLFNSFVDLSEDFYNAILRAPVPLRTDVLAALKRSPLALDVYMWVSYRLFTLQAAGQEQVSLGYGRLQEQFGTGIAEKNYRQFRRELKLAFAKVAQYWVSPDGERQLLNYELHEDGLTLFRSPLLISVPRRKVMQSEAEEEAARILTSKKFDEITMKQASQIAGAEWDIKYLQAQYFAWIERKGLTPKTPRAHFLSFVRRHRQRNEKKA